MKAFIESKKLYKALKKIHFTSFSKLPILNYILLKFEKDELIICSASEFILKIERIPTAKSGDSFEICVPYLTRAIDMFEDKRIKVYPFFDLIELYMMENALLEFELIELDKLKVVHENCAAVFIGITAEEFPPIKNYEEMRK